MGRQGEQLRQIRERLGGWRWLVRLWLSTPVEF
jgi:hypothetical protein